MNKLKQLELAARQAMARGDSVTVKAIRLKILKLLRGIKS